MSITFASRKDPGSEVNVTPLIDILLVLLIIFMVLPHNRGEKAEIPQRSEPPMPQPDLVVIQLTDAGESNPPGVSINHQSVAWEALERKLQEIYQTRSQKQAFLQGDPEVDFQYVAQALDIARHAGVDRVGLMNVKDLTGP